MLVHLRTFNLSFTLTSFHLHKFIYSLLNILPSSFVQIHYTLPPPIIYSPLMLSLINHIFNSSSSTLFWHTATGIWSPPSSVRSQCDYKLTEENYRELLRKKKKVRLPTKRIQCSLLWLDIFKCYIVVVGKTLWVYLWAMWQGKEKWPDKWVIVRKWTVLLSSQAHQFSWVTQKGTEWCRDEKKRKGRWEVNWNVIHLC